MHKDQRKVDRLRRLNEIYWPYGELDCVFDDRNTRELLRPAAPGRPRALQLRRRRDRLGPLPRRGPPAGAARDRRAARARPEEDEVARPPSRARGPARAGDLRRRGRRARLAPSRTSTPGCAPATCPSWTSSCGPPASPPACPAGSWRTAARRTAFNRNFYRLYKDLPARELRAPGQGGAAGLHPAAHPARGDPPHPRAQAPRRQGDPGHRRAGLPRRVARAPRRRADRRAARRARRPLHGRAGRAAADRRRPRRASPPASPPTTASTSPTATPTATASATCRCSSSSATRTRSTRTSGSPARRAGAAGRSRPGRTERAAV